MTTKNDPVNSGAPNGIRRSVSTQALMDRRYKSLDLRIQGVPFREIARQQKLSLSTVVEDVQKALREREGGRVEQLRAIEEARLDVAIAEAMNILNKNKGTELALKAVDRILRAVTTRANLLGLNAPVELTINSIEKTQADLELEELLREAQTHNQITREQLIAQATGEPTP